MDRRRTFLPLAGALLLMSVWTLAAGALPPAVSPGHPGSQTNGARVELVSRTGGATTAVVVQGSRAYIGEATRLVILDLGSPVAPVRLGAVELGSSLVSNIQVAGTLAYVAAGSELHIVDVTNPANPVRVGGLGMGHIESPVVVAGGYVYLADGYGVEVVDVSNPAAPAIVAKYSPEGGPVAGLALNGEYLYVAAGAFGGTLVLDVSNPRQPVQTATVPEVWGAPCTIAVAGSHAYVGSQSFSGGGGLYVLDIADAARPAVADYYEMADVIRVQAAGDRLYLLGWSSLIVMDRSTPALPARIGSYAVTGSGSDLALADGETYVYVAAGWGGLEVVDVSGVGGPVETGFYYPPGEALSVVVVGQVAYVDVRNAGVRIVDVSDLAIPREIGVYQPPAGTELAGAAGNHLYFLTPYEATGRLWIVDVSAPSQPVALGSYVSAADLYPRFLATVGHYLYLAGYGIDIVDLSDPAHPVKAGSFYQSVTGGMAAAGSYLYVTTGYSGGLQVLDVSNPTAPVKRGYFYAYGHTVRQVVSDGQIAYQGEHLGEDDWLLRVVDVSDPDHPAPLGSLRRRSIGDLALVGTSLYVAANGGLQVVDVSDPAQLRVAGSIANWSIAGFAMTGPSPARAYVAAGWDGFRVVDVSHVAPPRRAGGYDLLPGSPVHVAVAGGRAYVADGNAGLKVVDVTDPAAPLPRGALPLPGAAREVMVAGQRAYVAVGYRQGGTAEEGGLFVVDVSDPAAPRQTGYALRTWRPQVGQYSGMDLQALAVDDGLAYVGAGWSGLRIVDLSDPATPTALDSDPLYLGEQIRDVAVQGTFAYVTNAWHRSWNDRAGLRIVDVSQPLTPTETGFADDWTPYGVAVNGTHAYLATTWQGLRVVDASDPAAPYETGSYAVPAGGSQDVAVAGNYAFLGEEHGLRVLSISDPQQPVEVGSFYLPGSYSSVRDVVLSGTVAYAATWESLLLLDVSDPTRPQLLATYTRDDSSILGGAVAGHLAYLAISAYGQSGLQVLDVADPAQPVPLGFAGLADVGGPLAVVGSTVYVCGSDLWIVDVSDPAAPAQVGVYNAPWAAKDVAVAGTTAYVALGTDGVHVLDVGNAAKPTRIGSIPGSSPEGIWGLAAAGNSLYLNKGWTAVQVVDVSNPRSPSLLGSYATPVVGLAAAGSAVFVADGSGLQIVDVSAPASPAAVGRYVSPGDVNQVTSTGARLYLSESSGVVRIVDASDPAAPAQVGFYLLPTAPGGVAVDGAYLYVAAGPYGLYVLRYTGPVGPSLQVSPAAVTWLARAGSPDPAPRLVHLDSSGGPFAWTAEIDPAVVWLAATPLNGTTPGDVGLTPHLAGLAVGEYHTQLVVTGEAGVEGGPRTIPVTLVVAEALRGVYLPLVFRK